MPLFAEKENHGHSFSESGGIFPLYDRLNFIQFRSTQFYGILSHDNVHFCLALLEELLFALHFVPGPHILLHLLVDFHHSVCETKRPVQIVKHEYKVGVSTYHVHPAHTMNGPPSGGISPAMFTP
jgi:hypothetical protein